MEILNRKLKGEQTDNKSCGLLTVIYQWFTHGQTFFILPLSTFCLLQLSWRKSQISFIICDIYICVMCMYVYIYHLWYIYVICVCVCIYMRVCIYICICVYIYIYTYTYIYQYVFLKKNSSPTPKCKYCSPTLKKILAGINFNSFGIWSCVVLMLCSYSVPL